MIFTKKVRWFYWKGENSYADDFEHWAEKISAPVLSLKTYIHLICIYHEKDKTFISWWEGFFALIEGEEFSFGLMFWKQQRLLECCHALFLLLVCMILSKGA